MNNHAEYSSPPPPLPPSGYGGGPSPYPGGAPHEQPRPQVLQIVSKPGGLGWAWGTILGLFVLGATLLVGIAFGFIACLGYASGARGEDYILSRTYRDGGSKTVAILPVVGTINDRQAEFVHAAVDKVLDDRSIRAVVLRVDSPGGEVAASDEIWNEVKRLKDAGLPVVASYGGVAASGGYYVSCGSDYIMAEETCITGSIGVIAQALTFEGLMNKVGVQPVTIVATNSPEKDVANDTFRSWSDRDKAKVRMLLDSAYAIFNKRVRDGRVQAISDPAKIDQIANGSIYTAQEAKSNGLIDGIGYLDDAIAQAETLARLGTGASTVIMLKKPSALLGDFFAREQAHGGYDIDADAIRGLASELSAPRVMYLMR